MVKKVFFAVLLFVCFTTINVYAKSEATLQLKDSAITNGVALIVLGITIIVTSIRMKISNVD